MSLHEKSTANESHGLPNYYYTDARIQAQEIEKIFRCQWLIVGREEDIARGGDYLTCEVGDEPLVVVRNHQGQLQAMYNVCAHRGMRLAEGSGNCERLRCPYHGWTYDLNGQLRGVPFKECLPEVETANIRLQPVRLDTWGGFIFVNLDSEAGSLRAFLGDMTARWEAYHADWEGLRAVKRISCDEPFNWKLFMENAVDYYHVPFIHQETLDLPPILKNVPAGWHFMLTSTTPATDYTRYFDLLFPNLYFHVSTSKIQALSVTPMAPDRCQVTVVLYQTPMQAAEYPINDSGVHRDIQRFLDEDFTICRVLQQQARSSAYRIRYTAHKLEEGVAHYDRMILEALQQ